MARNYMQAYIPESSESEYSVTRTTWAGINKNIIIDSGALYSGKMIIPHGTYIESAPLKTALLSKTYNCVLGAHGFNDFCVIIYKTASNGDTIYIDYVTSAGTVYTGTLKTEAAADTGKRSLVQFNVYTTPLDPLSGTYSRKILIFPDKVSMDYSILENFSVASFASGTPSITYPTVFLSRLFGVDKERVYASEFNNYTGWDLDTANESLESNAWATTSQSNTKADSMFTAITTYDGHVVCFKDDFMHQIYNTKNPFRIVDIGQFGCINNESVTEAGGYLFFVSHNGVNIYSGAYPSIISADLGISDYTGSKLTSYDDVVYFYNNGVIYTYDVKVGVWGARDTSLTVLSLFSNGTGAFAVTSTGIYNLNGSSYPATLGDSEFITDLMALGVTSVSRLKKIFATAYFSAGSQLTVYAVTSSGDVQIGTYTATANTTRTMRILARMFSGDFQQLKFKIKGYVRIYKLAFAYSKDRGVYKS